MAKGDTKKKVAPKKADAPKAKGGVKKATPAKKAESKFGWVV